MAPVYALDRFYLSLTLLVTVVYQLLGFAIAWTFQFDKITDFTGGKVFDSLVEDLSVDSLPTRVQLFSSGQVSIMRQVKDIGSRLLTRTHKQLCLPS
jgi:hypothetical protein